jgi:hypothetical protein
VQRGAGLRLGELLDLELGAVVDYGPAGSWLRVPLGKLRAERSVPLDPDTLAACSPNEDNGSAPEQLEQLLENTPQEGSKTYSRARLEATRWAS